MPQQGPYDTAFFDLQKEGSYRSAATVIPQVLPLCRPASVVDFGCGVGTWLRAFMELGISDVTGLDGDYVKDELLVIPHDRFLRADLTQPIDLKRKFDLVTSLEVAEHLPHDRAAVFVETLTRHGEVILFSAAVPSQGGTHHINEQWPQYWNALFQQSGFTCVDCLRGALWDNPAIDWWYRQNILMFVANHRLATFPVPAHSLIPGNSPLNLVHPDLFLGMVNEDRQYGIRTLLKKIPGSLATSWRWHKQKSDA